MPAETNPLYIERCITSIQERFPENWFHQYSFDVDNDQWKTRQDAFEEHLSDTVNILIDYLNLSVIEGEYLLVNDYVSKLKAFTPVLASVHYDGANDEIGTYLLETLKDNFVDFFRAVLTIYIDFVYQVNRKIKLEPKVNLLDFNSGLDSHQTNFKDKSKEHLLSYFYHNLTTAYYDIFLQSSDDIDELNDLYGRVKNTTLDKPYTPLIIAKIELLIAKLILRKQFLQYKSKSDPVYISDSYNERLASAVEFVRNDFFKKWIEYASAHYLADYLESERLKLKDAALRVPHLVPANIKEVWDLHRLIKFYKDTSPQSNIEKLREIREFFYTKFTNHRHELSTHDLYALSVNLNYAINNEFSALCGEPECSIDKASALYNKVLEIQSITGIKNFFPQHKLIDLHLSKIRTIYKGKKSIQSARELRRHIDKCKELLDTYEVNVKWAERSYNYAFCLPHEECLVSVQDSNSKIFVFSSFVLPLEKEIYSEDFEKYKIEVAVLERTVDVIENIETDVQNFNSLKSSLESNLKSFQEETRSREIKSMEVLGIFTAIITFIAASIPSFRFIEDVKQAILFMIALSLSLCFFIVAIVFIRKLNELGARAMRVYRKSLIVVAVLGVITWVLLLASSGLEMYKDNEKVKSKQQNTQTVVANDSTVKAVVPSDSVTRVLDTTAAQGRKDSIKK